NVLEFWRRWNTYWRDYLMVLAYYPVATPLRRSPRAAVLIAGACTFAFGGVTHALPDFINQPPEATPPRFLHAPLSTLLFGFFVVIWLLVESVRRQRRGGARKPKASTPVGTAFAFASTAATLLLVSAILALFARPFGIPHPSAIELMHALTRAPFR